MNIVVTGMHRSGTSMVTGLLEMCGARTGISNVAETAAEDNPKGFWEREDVRTLNDAIFEAAGCKWDCLSRFDLSHLSVDDRSSIRAQIKELTDTFDPKKNWVVKDPRFSFTLPLWAELLGDFVCVVPKRNPLSCAVSLRSRNGYPLSFSQALWEYYTAGLLNVIRDHSRVVFVDYEEILNHPTQEIPLLVDAVNQWLPVKLKHLNEADISRFVDRKLNRSEAKWESEEWKIQPSCQLLSEKLSDKESRGLGAESYAVSDWASSEMVAFEKYRSEFDLLYREKCDEAESMVTWAKSLEQDVKARDDEINKSISEKDALTDWARSLEKTVSTRDETILEMRVELKDTRDELMKISNWAHKLNLRVKKYESSRVLSRVERAFDYIQFQKRLIQEKGCKQFVKTKFRGMQRKYFPKQYLKNLTQKKYSEVRDSLKANERKCTVVFSVINWDFRWQRPQQILSRMADEGTTVLYLSVNLYALKTQDKHGVLAVENTAANILSDHIFELALPSFNPVNIYTDQLENMDLDLMEHGLSSVLGNLNNVEITYIVHLPTWKPLLDKVKQKHPGKVIFDCMDDHSGFDTSTSHLIALEDDLIKESDAIVVSSDHLENTIQSKGRDSFMIRNACEYRHFCEGEKNDVLNQCEGKKIVGYYGAISSWYDTDIIIACAKKFPECVFVLIGNDSGCDTSGFEGLENILMLGEIPYAELPCYYAWFDVCLIPFKIIPLIKATNPVKFYEYLCQGKPVVSTALPELEVFSDLCYIAQDRDEFVDKLGVALVENDPELVERRKRVAHENSWSARCESFLELIERK